MSSNATVASHCRTALVQQLGLSDHAQSIAYTTRGIVNAAKQGAQLIILQELHASLYFCQSENPDNFDLAETIPGRTTDALAKVAREQNVVIVTSIFEKRGAGIHHNTACVIESDGTIAGIYRKMHIPHDPGFNEKYYFTPGDLGFTPIHTSVGCLGVLVCWDQWFPEAARAMALAGADILIYPTAIGWLKEDGDVPCPLQRDAWITIQRSHAIANSLPVIACNRVGYEPHPTDPARGINFWGASFISDVNGHILAQASGRVADPTEPEVIVTDIDLSATEVRRRLWPYGRDRRIDAYTPLLTHGDP